jgi:CelD/BcsL family acetyltransferase involved in cellulose biosynthesis
MLNTRTEIISDFSVLSKLGGEWDELWKSDNRRTIFGTFAWARASWHAFGSRSSLFAIVAWRGDQLTAILPLVAVDNTLQFLGYVTSDYNDLVCSRSTAADSAAAVLQALTEMSIPWRRCVLGNLPQHSKLLDGLSSVSDRIQLRTHLSVGANCPSIDLSVDADRTLEEILKKKSLRRHETKLSRLGEIRFRHIDSRCEAKAHLPMFFRQHIARRAMCGDRSILCSEDVRVFYEYLLDQFDLQRELRFSVVELDSRPIAYHLGFEENGTFVWYKPTFDVDLWEFSPGEVLLKKLLEYARTRNLTEFDFTIGDERFKHRFANQITTNYTLEIYPPGPRGHLRHISTKAKDSLKKRPRVFSGLTAIKAPFDRASRGLQRSAKALRKHGIVRICRRLFGAAWSRLVFSRVAVLVFAYERVNGIDTKSEIEIREGRLSDLAHLAAAHIDDFPAERLTNARERLRMGDKLYVAWKKDECAHVAWTRLRNELTASSELGDRCRLNLGKPAVIIYDCWTPSDMRGKGYYPTVIREIVRLDETRGTEHYIYCRSDNLPSVRGIIKAGFKLRYRMRRTCILGIIESVGIDDFTRNHVEHQNAGED